MMDLGVIYGVFYHFILHSEMQCKEKPKNAVLHIFMLKSLAISILVLHLQSYFFFFMQICMCIL